MLIESRVEPNIYRRERASGVTYKVRMLVAGRPRTHTVDTLAEARRVRGILEAKRAQAAEHGSATSFQRWWEGWIQLQSGAESTRKTYESLAKCHVLPYFGEREVSSIKVSDVIRFRNKLDAQGLGRATVDKCISSVLGGPLSSAVADGLIPSNPVRALPRRKSSQRSHRRTVKYLEPEQVDAIEAHMPEPWRIVLRFQVETALRIGEVAALRVRDVDLTHGVVHVSASMSKAGKAHLVPTKTAAGERSVPLLSADTCRRLREVIVARGARGTDWLFSGPRGGKLHQDTYRNRVLRPAVEAAGLGHLKVNGRGISPHWLRHTGITDLVKGTSLDLMSIAAMAGHRDARVTQGIYTHLNPADMTHARQEMESFRRNRKMPRDGQTA